MKKRSLLALAMVGALSVSMLAGCGSSSTKRHRLLQVLRQQQRQRKKAQQQATARFII